MTFGQDAVDQLSRELLRGYNLNTRLLDLLRGEPLDSRRQEAAAAMTQELSGVFGNLMVSLFMLKSGDSGGGGGGGVGRTLSLLPEATITDGSVDQRIPAKDKRISREELTPHAKARGEVVREEITTSPFEDVYQWRKYGQKNIQNRQFARVYYKCMHSHGRGCRAKKQVQQRDNSIHRPMYQVTYVNEHSCHQLLPDEPTRAPPTSTPNVNNIDHPQHHVVVRNAEFENKIMTCTLATVISGAPSPSSLPWPPQLESSQPRDLASTYISDGGAHYLPSASQVDVNMDLDETFICSPEATAAPWSPVQVRSSYVPANGGYWSTLDHMATEEIFPAPFSPVFASQSISWEDMPMAVTGRLLDSTSAWPQDN